MILNEKLLMEIGTKALVHINHNVWQFIILKMLKLKQNLCKLESDRKITLPFVEFFSLI